VLPTVLFRDLRVEAPANYGCDVTRAKPVAHANSCLPMLHTMCYCSLPFTPMHKAFTDGFLKVRMFASASATPKINEASRICGQMFAKRLTSVNIVELAENNVNLLRSCTERRRFPIYIFLEYLWTLSKIPGLETQLCAIATPWKGSPSAEHA
jgi:hypothetical protein